MNAPNRTFSVPGYRLARHYGMTSLIAMAITALVIFVFIRYESIKIIEDASKRSNETLTIATEYALNDHFVMFLNVVKQNKDRTNVNMPFEPMLENVIDKMLTDTDVARIKLYDLSGNVVYSSDPTYVDDTEEHSDAFEAARLGVPKTTLVYDDGFSLFNNTGEHNLVQTYVPIRASEKTTVLGVMEIYSDISEYIIEANKTIYVLLSITLLLIAFLYFFLLFHIKRSERIIENQNRDTREKKKLLEYLTSKMITAQEDEKKRIAFELHEDVVQTLSGVKMQLERYILSVDQINENSEVMALSKNIVPILQEASHKIRSVAIDLRPPSLDDFGLEAALNSLTSECHTIITGLEIVINIQVDEEEISHDQKSILYRMFKDTLKSICFNEKLEGVVRFTLSKDEGRLVLQATIISDIVRNNHTQSLPVFFESMQERTILSGGEFIKQEHVDDRLSVESVWLTDM